MYFEDHLQVGEHSWRDGRSLGPTESSDIIRYGPLGGHEDVILMSC